MQSGHQADLLPGAFGQGVLSQRQAQQELAVAVPAPDRRRYDSGAAEPKRAGSRQYPLYDLGVNLAAFDYAALADILASGFKLRLN